MLVSLSFFLSAKCQFYGLWNLLAPVGDMYCFNSTLKMLVSSDLGQNMHGCLLTWLMLIDFFWNDWWRSIHTSCNRIFFFCAPGLKTQCTIVVNPLLSTSSTFQKLLNGFWWNLTESKYSMSTSTFVFFRTDPSTKMDAMTSALLRHSRLIYITAELKSSKYSASSTKWHWSL